MKNFILGTIFGIVLCTVGLAGLVTIFDKGVTVVKDSAKELAK